MTTRQGEARAMGTPAVSCPDCGMEVSLPDGASSGDLAECPRCAGLTLGLEGGPGAWAAIIAHRVSCPSCEPAIVLPEASRPGDALECCGRRWRLTFEYGAFAAEPDRGSAR